VEIIQFASIVLTGPCHRQL